jgi:hypothetical protein
MFVICRLPLEDHSDSTCTYRTLEGGWSKKVEKAERFETREGAQTVLAEHSWGDEGHAIEEVAA